jgi:hypothetical protein
VPVVFEDAMAESLGMEGVQLGVVEASTPVIFDGHSTTLIMSAGPVLRNDPERIRRIATACRAGSEGDRALTYVEEALHKGWGTCGGSEISQHPRANRLAV